MSNAVRQILMNRKDHGSGRPASDRLHLLQGLRNARNMKRGSNPSPQSFAFPGRPAVPQRQRHASCR